MFRSWNFSNVKSVVKWKSYKTACFTWVRRYWFSVTAVKLPVTLCAELCSWNQNSERQIFASEKFVFMHSHDRSRWHSQVRQLPIFPKDAGNPDSFASERTRHTACKVGTCLIVNVPFKTHQCVMFFSVAVFCQRASRTCQLHENEDLSAVTAEYHE